MAAIESTGTSMEIKGQYENIKDLRDVFFPLPKNKGERWPK